MAEVIKHAIIDGEENFSFLEQSVAAWKDPQGFDFRRCPYGILERIVAESQRVKLGFVKRDFKERNVRKTLNLGHTFGHAIEASLHLPHGHSVACASCWPVSFLSQKALWNMHKLSGSQNFLESAACRTGSNRKVATDQAGVHRSGVNGQEAKRRPYQFCNAESDRER